MCLAHGARAHTPAQAKNSEHQKMLQNLINKNTKHNNIINNNNNNKTPKQHPISELYILLIRIYYRVKGNEVVARDNSDVDDGARIVRLSIHSRRCRPCLGEGVRPHRRISL